MKKDNNLKKAIGITGGAIAGTWTLAQARHSVQAAIGKDYATALLAYAPRTVIGLSATSGFADIYKDAKRRDKYITNKEYNKITKK